jgi:hypothetical protein
MVSAIGNVLTTQPESVSYPRSRLGDSASELDTLRGLGRKLDPNDPRVVREAATLLASQLFFAPLLAEMRKLPFGKEFAYGGRAEEAFGEQLDQCLADTVARDDQGFTRQLAERLASRYGSRSSDESAPSNEIIESEREVADQSPKRERGVADQSPKRERGVADQSPKRERGVADQSPKRERGATTVSWQTLLQARQTIRRPDIGPSRSDAERRLAG